MKRDAGEEHEFFVDANLVLALWGDRVPVESIRKFGELLASAHRSHGRFAVLVWLRVRGREGPPAREREAIARIMRENQPGYAALGYVFGGAGFGAAMVRMSLTAIHMLARPSYPVRVFEGAPPAIAWVAQAAAYSGDVPALVGSLTAAREDWAGRLRARGSLRRLA